MGEIHTLLYLKPRPTAAASASDAGAEGPCQAKMPRSGRRAEQVICNRYRWKEFRRGVHSWHIYNATVRVRVHGFVVPAVPRPLPRHQLNRLATRQNPALAAPARRSRAATRRTRRRRRPSACPTRLPRGSSVRRLSGRTGKRGERRRGDGSTEEHRSDGSSPTSAG